MPPKQQRRVDGYRDARGRDSGGSKLSGPPGSARAPSSASKGSTKLSQPNMPDKGTSPTSVSKPPAKHPSMVRDYEGGPGLNGISASVLDIAERQSRLEIEALDKHLHTINMVRLPIAKDGACLFRSMAQALFSNQTLHLKVREACVDYLLQHEEDYKDFIDIKADSSDKKAVHREYLQYAERMRLPTAWAGQLELQALSQLYMRNFIIFQALPVRVSADSTASGENSHPQYRVESTPIENNFQDTIHLAYSLGNHYDVVMSVSELARLIYFQNLAHHAIETLFCPPSERSDYWLRPLSFEEDPPEPLSPQQLLQLYDNRQWKIWQGKLQKETSSDELLARRLIAEETGDHIPKSDDTEWCIAGKKKKKKTNAYLQQQQARLAAFQELGSLDLTMEQDAKLAASLHDSWNGDSDAAAIARQLEEDEKIAQELAQLEDERLALRLSQEESTPSYRSIPGSARVTRPIRQPAAPSPSFPSYHSEPSYAPVIYDEFAAPLKTSYDSKVDQLEDDGFIPASKKAKKALAAAKAEQERTKRSSNETIPSAKTPYTVAEGAPASRPIQPNNRSHVQVSEGKRGAKTSSPNYRTHDTSQHRSDISARGRLGTRGAQGGYRGTARDNYQPRVTEPASRTSPDESVASQSSTASQSSSSS